MQQTVIWKALKKSILEVLPNFSGDISLESSLNDLGANSIDRAEIIMLTLQQLKLNIPLMLFAQTKNINELITVFDSAN